MTLRDRYSVHEGIDQIASPATTEVVNGNDRSRAPNSAAPVSGRPALPMLPVVSASSFAGLAIPSRRWHVEDLIPAGTVTLLGGDGGAGKSLLALQLAVSTAIGLPWIGFNAEYGPALYLTAEDDIDEVHRRLVDISRAMCLSLAQLASLSVCSLAGEDALLATADRQSGVLKATKLYEAVKARIEDLTPVLVVLDTLADLFGGEENDRAQARQFISLLRRLALQCGTTVVLLAHPSLSGMQSGSGMSGSTAWNNSVRSRLYLDRPKIEGRVADPDGRILETKKANYGRIGDQIRLRWRDGVFVREEDSSQTPSGEPAGKRSERVFLDMLRAYERSGRRVSPAQSAAYAPVVFAKDELAMGLSKRELIGAMNRLFAANVLAVEEVGPPSRRTKSIIIVKDRRETSAIGSHGIPSVDGSDVGALDGAHPDGEGSDALQTIQNG